VDADEILTLLDELQRRMDGPARYVFELSVRHVWTSALMGVVFGAICIIVGLFVIRLVWRRYSSWKPDANLYSSNDRDIPTVMLSALIALGAYIAATDLIRLLNPEYTALVELIEKVVP
jgi:hypothetical protein